MIGNDVIDLELASIQSNWQRRGFLDKIFTEFEKELILSAENPEHKVWDLWSRKESVYKIINRETGIRIYNPLAFVCLDDEPMGKARYGSRIFHTKTDFFPNQIHTICCEHPDTFLKIQTCEKQEISKQTGFPTVLYRGSHRPASVSNHGKFEHCVFLLP